jgi:predicted GIY-YIG superfamily endonuclease
MSYRVVPMPDLIPPDVLCAITGLPGSFFRQRIARGEWHEGVNYLRRPGGQVVYSLSAYERYAEHGPQMPPVRQQPELGAVPNQRRRRGAVRREVPTALYRHFAIGGQLLYVGISLSLAHRLSQHMNGAGWATEIARVDVQWFPARHEAEAAERDAIEHEKPLHNKAHNR